MFSGKLPINETVERTRIALTGEGKGGGASMLLVVERAPKMRKGDLLIRCDLLLDLSPATTKLHRVGRLDHDQE